MPYDPSRHGRRSIRLRGYDYTQPGWYFVTTCTQGRQKLFGRLKDGEMHPSEAGDMIAQWWARVATKYATVQVDAFVVMPDHVHGIIVISDANAVGADSYIRPYVAGGYMNPPIHNANDASDDVGADSHIRPADSHIRPADSHIRPADSHIRPDEYPSLSTIVQWFKIMTTTDYIRQVKHAAWPPFDRRVWQRGYYERIIRDERALEAVRRYITHNPAIHAARLDALLARMEYKEQR